MSQSRHDRPCCMKTRRLTDAAGGPLMTVMRARCCRQAEDCADGRFRQSCLRTLGHRVAHVGRLLPMKRTQAGHSGGMTARPNADGRSASRCDVHSGRTKAICKSVLCGASFRSFTLLKWESVPRRLALRKIASEPAQAPACFTRPIAPHAQIGQMKGPCSARWPRQSATGSRRDILPSSTT